MNGQANARVREVGGGLEDKGEGVVVRGVVSREHEAKEGNGFGWVWAVSVATDERVPNESVGLGLDVGEDGTGVGEIGGVRGGDVGDELADGETVFNLASSDQFCVGLFQGFGMRNGRERPSEEGSNDF